MSAKQPPDFSRRELLRLLGAGALSYAVPGLASAASAKRPPNIIVILTDDQGSLDAGCYGAKDLYTPNLDALAQRGVRFTQFYVGAPVCSPSRACLLTGRTPHSAGVPSNVGGDSGLPPEQITMAEMMKAAGYRTALFGKWHLGELPELSPIAQGFDEFYGHKHGCIDNYSHFFYWNGPNRHDMWRNEEESWDDIGAYFPSLIVREAHRFIEANQEKPFFLFLPFNDPHYPMQGEEKHRQRYAHLDEPRRAYAAFVSTVDEKIGEVVNKVDALGLREDTIIVFMSDHGHSVEERCNFGGGWAGPYRGHKFTLWEGGIRVPAIISWPGHLPEGEARDQVACSADWLPTLAALSGATPPEVALDGKDITALIQSAGAKSPHEALHWESNKHWAVRRGPWKLVYQGPESTIGGKKIRSTDYFLSNLDKDVSETENLAEAYPEIVEELEDLHRAWVKRRYPL